MGHRRHNHRTQQLIHVIGRNNDAGPGLLNLRTYRRVQINQPNFIQLGYYQTHSSRSNSFSRPSSNSSSLSVAPPALKDSAHPSRGRRSGAMTSRLFSIDNCTVLPKPHCSINAFGMRMPRELPIRMIAVRTVTTLYPLAPPNSTAPYRLPCPLRHPWSAPAARRYRSWS